MSGICGIFSFDAPNPSREEISLMNEAILFRGKDHVGVQCEGNVAMGSALMRTTPQSLTETFPMQDADGGLLLTADARLDNRTELMALLDLKETAGNPITDGTLILASYRKWGEECAERLLGDFAFALWDPRERKLFCARDHFGIRPFCYHSGKGRFHFASEVSALIVLPGIPREVEEIYVRDYLCRHWEEKALTAFKGIFRLEPAHTLAVKEGGDLCLRRFWRMDAEKEHLPATDEEYIEGFREKLFAAVSRRLLSIAPVASELSGGQDSSMVVAVAQKLLQQEGRSLKTFSHALPKGEKRSIDDLWQFPSDSDERPLVDLILSWCGLTEHTYVTGESSPGYLELSRALQHSRGYPFLSGYGNLAFPLNRSVADSNCKVLLSGLGGDQCVTGFGDGYYAELYRNSQWKTIIREARGLSRIYGSSVFRNLFSNFFLEAHPDLRRLLLRLFRDIRDYRKLDFTRLFISPDFAVKTDALATYKERRENYILGWAIPGISHKEQELLGIEWGYIPNSAEDRSNGTLLCGVENRFPLLDKELMEYVFSLPSRIKVRDGWKRYIARKGMEGFLPQEVVWRKRKRGPATIPYWHSHIVKDIEGIRRIGHAIAEDTFILQFMNGKPLLNAVLCNERRNDRKSVPLNFKSHAIAMGLFLQTVDQSNTRNA